MQIEQKLRKIEDLFLQIVTIWRKKLYVKKILGQKIPNDRHISNTKTANWLLANTKVGRVRASSL